MHSQQDKKKGLGYKGIMLGSIIQCCESLTLGQPLEIWKTRMGAYPEGSIQSIKSIYTQGGGIKGFWQGIQAKLVESSLKGGVLMYSKENLMTFFQNLGVQRSYAGFLAGAGGGVSQVVVMGPCTFIVTMFVIDRDRTIPVSQSCKTLLKQKGIKQFYKGGVALGFRQASNWASRQGFTEYFREVMLRRSVGNKKLTKSQEIVCGTMGGILACWNHPIELARIMGQKKGAQGLDRTGMFPCIAEIFHEYGIRGLYRGLVPRVCLGIWQTLFMVTGAIIISDSLNSMGFME